MQEAEGNTLSGWVHGVRSAATVRMERMSLARCRHLIVISPYVLDYFRDRIVDTETHAIENPLEERFFRIEGARDARAVLFAGRLIPRKDPETLLRAAGHLARQGVEFRLRIAGDADDAGYAESLKALARDQRLGERVAFLGALSPARMEEELGAASVFVQSSRQETASVAIMEAMAAGLAIVATDVGGTRHLVEDPASGRLVPPRDAEILSRALVGYLATPEAAQAAGNRGREIARGRFRVGEVVDRTLQVYQRALEPAPGLDSLQSTGSRGRN
jgi:glycosyltransferase involved in cell wall biosynthesis